MAEYALFCVRRSLNELLCIPELRVRIELIQEKLRKLQSILQVVDARQEVDEGIRSWVAETREVAYDIEDLLLVANTSAQRKEGTIFRRSPSMFKVLHPKIQEIDDKISALESSQRVRNIKPRQIEIQSPRPKCLKLQEKGRRMYLHLVEEDFIGLDDDVQKLVARLVKDDEAFPVVSITGKGGIGKTTIAKKIYHHGDVRRHFHGFAWACVSQKWQHEDVLQRILNKLEPEKKNEINGMKADMLVNELYQIQRRKRCLIVLDDVWEMQVWDIFRPVFETGGEHVKIKVLITTRDKEIARYVDMGAPCYLYEQRTLNEKESWELLKKKVSRGGLNIAGISFDRGDQGNGRSMEENESSTSFEEDDDASSSAGSFYSCLTEEEDEDEITSQLDTPRSVDYIQDKRNQMDIERLGREMVAQCEGLPLAIVVLGGLLMTKLTVCEWRTVHQNLNAYLRRGRGFRESGAGAGAGAGAVHEVLALSYHDLPYQLKPCFLHLGNFPEDFKIPTRKLYQLWSAEGFISPEGEEHESIMDISERYLGELVQRCMVQVHVDKATGRFKSCQLHDLTRDLCLVKGKEENFLKKVPPRYEPKIIIPPSPLAIATSVSNARRLSITVDYDFGSYFPSGKEISNKHVRSALFFSRLSKRRNLQAALDFLCEEFHLLRVLDLERFDFGERLSKEIGNLVYLRYLSLRGSKFSKLPSSICNLRCLQTLDLRVSFLVCLSIPDVIWKLNHLKHLYLPPNHTCKAKLQIGTLNQLETLKNFDTSVSDYRDLFKLTKLQKLAAILALELENLEPLISSLKSMSQHIKGSSFRIRYDFKSEKEFTVLRELVGFTHLRKLDLIGVMHSLPDHSDFAQSLNKLTLRTNRLNEDPMATLEKLSNLYSLILRKNVFEVKQIRCTPQGFPQLTNLELQGLTSLESWTIEEGAMPNLFSLKIDECINLKMLPEGIKFITTLKELVIVNMPEPFKKRIQKVQGEGGEDSHKVEHISSITITVTNIPHTKQRGKQLPGSSYSGLLHSVSPALVPKVWQNS
ncbi:probable disease resistance RPP8-like protein 2 [Andrographis paniculata]|uniref:probable disease resistance RPP8-like protein 2 n=1 Tax=Andrographis paniculata TaxID=175694 RepID=UPI0021E75B8B|nr:probable disease resistance RPP8-like protein 2 [Andrographis paniculata]